MKPPLDGLTEEVASHAEAIAVALTGRGGKWQEEDLLFFYRHRNLVAESLRQSLIHKREMDKMLAEREDR